MAPPSIRSPEIVAATGTHGAGFSGLWPLRLDARRTQHGDMKQPLAAHPSTGQPRKGLCAYASCVALSAYGGAIGLATGNLDLGHELDQRLPLRSPVLGGIALALVVGVPATVVGVFAKRGDRRADVASVVAGSLLIAWILVELAFIRDSRSSNSSTPAPARSSSRSGDTRHALPRIDIRTLLLRARRRGRCRSEHGGDPPA